MPYAICEQQRRRSACASRSLIITFVVRRLDSIIPLLAISKMSRPWLVPVAEQAGLCLTWSKIPEDRYSRDEAHISQSVAS